MKINYLLILCLFPVLLSAQSLRKFTEEKGIYQQELTEYLEDENPAVEEEELALLMRDFDTVWSSPSFRPEEEKQVYVISNNFLRKRLSNYTTWREFILLIKHLKENEEDGALLTFLKDLEEISIRPSAQIELYLHTIYSTFYDNIIYDDGRVRWEVIGENPVYTFNNEPQFEFENADLWGFYKNDSTLIEGVNIRYFPRNYMLNGTGGTAFFTRAGLTEDSAYVEIPQFELDVSKGDFEADSVTLYTEYYMNQPVMGVYSEKLTSQGGGNKSAVYPRFRSYSNKLVVPYLLPHANFMGGFSIVGSKFYGSGTEQEKARLRFMYNDTLLFDIRSERFLIRNDKVYSEDVEATIKLGTDSIYHPKLTMRYLPNLGRFSLIRNAEGLGSTPFSDTYHNLDMSFELLNWEVGSPLINFGSINIGGGEAPVVFESKEYFRSRRFREIEGFNTRNPLVHLQKMTEAHNNAREFTTEQVARYLRMDQTDAHIFLMRMSILGFVDYRVDARVATVNDKVFDYILNMRQLRDYDVIQFVSRVQEGSNAKLSLENYEMEIGGIEAIALSDSQRVGLYPYGQKIVMKENLNFDFDGQITAGRFNYWGRDFKFSYEGFMIAMTDIDSMRFKVLSFEPNALGQKYLVDVKTVLQDLTGELLIDKPNNKSGKNSYSEYPIFRSGKDSYIYYDKPSIFSGVYNREEFYVRLEPFVIDSLDNISTSGLTFDGTFTSAGIFPDLQQEIKVQPDYSLGFTTQTPGAGLSAYGRGTFTNTLSLSNKGLRGIGKINYLNSVANSEEFFFFPDSTNGLANNYEITKKLGGAGSNPHVTGLAVNLHWEPYNDVLYTTTNENRFDIYDDVGMKGKGTLAHAPTGLKGRGLMEFLNAETRSKDYTFESRKLLSSETAFRVRANPQTNWGFEVEKAVAEIDFDKQKGFFELKNPDDYFQFKANEYIAYMNFARWQIPEKAIDVSMKNGNQLSELVDVRPEHDSLRFMAERSKFYLEKDLLEVFKVPEIIVADASIFPDTGYVAIDTAADMRRLHNAAITANTLNEYHQFYGSSLKIRDANYFFGEGDYEYLDMDGTPWPIHFKEIKVDTGTTVGFAQISQEEAFYMSPYFAYYGNVRLRADRKDLEFRGYTHIESSCEAISTDWFQFHSLIEPSNILIELPEIDPNDNTKMLANGIYLENDTITGYAAFLSKQVTAGDKQMFFANGVLFYDEAKTSYVITTRDKIKDPNYPANILYFNNLACTMRGEGEMSLGDDDSQMDIRSFGTIDYDLETDDMKLDVFLGLDFFFSDKLSERMATLVKDYAQGSGVDMTSPQFSIAASFLMEDEKDRKEFFQDIKDYGAPEDLPKELQSTLLLGRTTMIWTPTSASFISEGQLGLSALGKNMVNTKLEGFFEIQRRRRGDEIYMIVDIDRTTYVYFEYKRNRLGVFSSDDQIMTILKEMDLDDRQREVKGKPTFTYMLSTKGKMNRFIRRFEAIEEEAED